MTHRFEERVGSTFIARGKHENAGGAIERVDIVRPLNPVNAVGDPQQRGQLMQPRLFRPVADNGQAPLGGVFDNLPRKALRSMSCAFWWDSWPTVRITFFLPP